jgi:hypothetical protein
MMQPVRVLAMDHYFDQDLSALEAHPKLDVRRFPYRRLRARALRIMGKEVARGLRTFNEPGIAAARNRYAAWLSRELERLYLERAFDVLVLPSDTFFYVRALPAAAHRLGLPVVVVQKETTVSRATMETFSMELGAEAPFISDFMTVCSERQREFWMRAGADADHIAVTGQPRFDIYASAAPARQSSRLHVLFLTYALDAYVPGAGRGKGLRTWEPLRSATETALIDLARAGGCEVVVKCHPQQDRRDVAHTLAGLAGPAWNRGVSLADQNADTRELIIGADVVVGFQTTALYEAVAARRSVIYAAWGEAYERYRGGLIPFHEAPLACVRHASSRDMLVAMLTDTPPPPASGCAAWYGVALGPVDGQATDRVAERLAGVAAASAPSEERRNLDRRRRRYAVGLLARSLAAEAVWTAAIPVANLAGERRRVGVMRHRAHEARSMAASTLRGEPEHHTG